MEVKIKWSDICYYQPIKIILPDSKSTKFHNKYYVKIKAMFDFEDGVKRDFILIVPWYPFKDAICAEPIEVQKMIKENPCEMEITKIRKGKMKIDNIKKR